MDFIKNYINDNLQNFIAIANLIGSLTVEHWIAIVSSVFIFGIIVANGHHSSSQLLVYGKNSLESNPKQNQPPSNDLFNTVVSYLQSFKVPKKYFVHFYIFFFILTIIKQLIFYNFQTNQYSQINEILTRFYQNCCVNYELSEINYKNLLVISNLLMIQACKRLYEDLFVSKFSNNSMNLLHYIFGLVFYLLLSMVNFIGLLPYYIHGNEFTSRPITLDLIDWLYIIAFIFYLIDQYQNHCHLASLVKYSIPTFRFFEYCTSPHYLDEIIMYTVMLSFYMGCESIGWIKADFWLIWILVVSNLCVSANESYKYYQNKFKEEFKTPYKLVPFVW